MPEQAAAAGASLFKSTLVYGKHSGNHVADFSSTRSGGPSSVAPRD
jgi:hypothetical protein